MLVITTVSHKLPEKFGPYMDCYYCACVVSCRPHGNGVNVATLVNFSAYCASAVIQLCHDTFTQ